MVIILKDNSAAYITFGKISTIYFVGKKTTIHLEKVEITLVLLNKLYNLI